MSVSIKYKGSEIAALTATGTKTLNTAGKYCEGNIIVENTESGGGGGDELGDLCQSNCGGVTDETLLQQGGGCP